MLSLQRSEQFLLSLLPRLNCSNKSLSPKYEISDPVHLNVSGMNRLIQESKMTTIIKSDDAKMQKIIKAKILKAKMLIWWIWMVAKQCNQCYFVYQQVGDIYHHLYYIKESICITTGQNQVTGCQYAVSPSRWMHDHVFENWFMEYFIPFVANDQKPVLVIYDAHEVT